MNCGVISVKRARSFDQHQISLEDEPRLEPLQILDFLKRLRLEDSYWVSSGRDGCIMDLQIAVHK